MTTERIKYEISPTGPRIIALIIDLIIVALITVFCQWGVELEWNMFWKPILFPDIEFVEIYWLMLLLMLIFSLLLYFILVPSFTNGQTVGKMIMGLYVVYDDNSSTKRKFVTHIKRLFFMRGGTKVVKVSDKRPEGL
ncbi:MAG: RDD family protein [Candidatus Thorarchaeota archaeon]